jgi:hypothetical protein
MVHFVPSSWINQPCDYGIILSSNDCSNYVYEDRIGYAQNVGYVVCCADNEVVSKSQQTFGKSAKKYCENYGTYQPLIVGENVFGGKQSEVGEFPHHVQIYYSSAGEFVTRCGGSLISDRFVITAAHCVNDNTKIPVYVRMGRVRELKHACSFDSGSDSF